MTFSHHSTIDSVGLLYVWFLGWFSYKFLCLHTYDEHQSKLSELLTLPNEKPKELKSSCQRTLICTVLICIYITTSYGRE